MGFYRETLQRYAEIGGRRLAGVEDPCAGIALTPEECASALEGNPPPCNCRMEVCALHDHWIVTVDGEKVRVTRARLEAFDPAI